MMQLSDNTLAVLKNFASIQPNVVLQEGNVVKTIAEAKNVMAVATLDQSFDKEVGIYNLDEFLSVLGLVDSPDLNFHDDFVTVQSGAGRSQVKYFYSDASILTSPAKDIPMPEAEVKFTLDEATFKKVLRAAGALGHEKMTITATDGGVDEIISTRRLVHIIKAFAIFNDRMTAIEMCTNRFDEETKLAFRDLYTKLDAGVISAEADEIDSIIEESETKGEY